MSTLRALFSALRPKQWIKNVLVFAAPFAAGVLLQPDVLLRTLLACALFCAVSSSIYLMNDLKDRESDRLHPTKRHRAIASGALSPAVGATMAGVLGVASLVVPALLGLWLLCWVITIYLVLQLLYVLWAKRVVVVDILIVASGFGLRGVAGAAASELEVSQWFVLVLGSASLFIVAGKRYAEKRKALVSPEKHNRPTLRRYTVDFLRFVWTLAATLAVLSYSLWAFQITEVNSTFALISVVPFLAGLMLYALDIERGESEAPEDVLLRDRGLLIAGVLWVVVFAVAVVLPHFN